MKWAIVDDQIEYLSNIKTIIQELKPYIEIDIYESGQAFLKYSDLYQLVFLDIDMPDLDGLKVARMLRSYDLNIVFITSYSDKMIDAFGKNVIGFVLKNDLKSGLKRIINEYYQEINEPYLTIINNQIEAIIYLDEIVYLTYNLRDITFHLLNQANQTIKEKNLKDIQKVLDNRFYQISRNTIINLDYAKDCCHGEVRIFDFKLPVSRRRCTELKIKILERKLLHVRRD